jgi:hypothetical protein
MDEDFHIDDLPSIRVKIQHGDKTQNLYLSSIYGSYNISSELYIPKDEIVLFFCPECEASLILKELCGDCSAPTAFFELKDGGKVKICSRRGCKCHSIEYSDTSQKISALYTIHEVLADPSRKE